jgi:hypothetical protein
MWWKHGDSEHVEPYLATKAKSRHELCPVCGQAREGHGKVTVTGALVHPGDKIVVKSKTDIEVVRHDPMAAVTHR